jgi:hypothetical protein
MLRQCSDVEAQETAVRKGMARRREWRERGERREKAGKLE